MSHYVAWVVTSALAGAGVICSIRKISQRAQRKRHGASEWSLAPSATAVNTFNPIRAIVDKMNIGSADQSKMISLSIGDPTIFKNMDTAANVVQEVVKAAQSGSYNGYPPASGYQAARQAIASIESRPDAPLTADDVIIASGCSGSLAIAIPTLCSQGDNILLPSPGFSLYVTICTHYGIEPRFYSLQPEKSWEADLQACEQLVDERTRAILINNPSNPCGSNYSTDHLKAIIAFAEKHKLPIISDEVYADMVFSGQKFTPIASLSKEVPVLAVGGTAKRYLVPGWRLGWILIHDRKNRLAKVRGPLMQMCQLVLGANSLIQAALPGILSNTPAEFSRSLNATLEEHATYCVKRAAAIDGLKPIVPQGAMYLLIHVDVAKFKDMADDVDFSRKLLSEEMVVVLPGSVFRANNFFRIVYCAPLGVLEKAFDRIEAFVKRHRK